MNAVKPRLGRGRLLLLTMLLSGGLLILCLLPLNSVIRAAPIDPPAGYPKLALSSKTVTPTLTHVGGETLLYTVEIRNTGAYTAAGTTLTDRLPPHVSYNDDAWASHAPVPTVENDVLSWTGDVGFDETVLVTYSVTIDDSFSGTLTNTAVISQAMIGEPISITADAVVTDVPILTLEKRAEPERPGANQPLTYTLTVRNTGQPATDLPVTVTDQVPAQTTLHTVGADGQANTAGTLVTWMRTVDLDIGETTEFTFSVDIGDVVSGTLLTNDTYQVASAETEVEAGAPHTITVVDPILRLTKSVWPDPPGANREMTYTLTLRNAGSLATQLIITDRVPENVTYVRGGSETDGVVSWTLPRLENGAFAEFTYTVYIGDVLDVPVVNDAYAVDCAELESVPGTPMTATVRGPRFEAEAFLDPIAHKPGGGTGTEVTPTLVVRNLGPGNALAASVNLYFRRISVSRRDVLVIPGGGSLTEADCGEKSDAYIWTGDIGYGEAVTFTSRFGENTIGGDEGTPYTATVVITDSLSNDVTEPITATKVGVVTHYANVVPTKSAPKVVGAGQYLTYTIDVFNRGLTTQRPPVLTDVIPLSTTFAWASHSGVTETLSDTTVVSWTLPLLSPGQGVVRQFAVQVDADLVSGTQIINNDYHVLGYGNIVTDAITGGPPVTTTVKEVGLIDSYKVVTPMLSLPGPHNVLTFYLHIVNSSPISLDGVLVDDLLPWENTTYQRDAVASAGEILSDIVSLRWTGDVAAFSKEIITLTVTVDPFYEGSITNTAVITHPTLRAPVDLEAIAHITEQPILRISKTASPDPLPRNGTLLYMIKVLNLGQEAASLVITDTLPSNVAYVPDSATRSGVYADGQMQWVLPRLGTGATTNVEFEVTPSGGTRIVNANYAVVCEEGISAVGAPVTTQIAGAGEVYLPAVMKAYP